MICMITTNESCRQKHNFFTKTTYTVNQCTFDNLTFLHYNLSTLATKKSWKLLCNILPKQPQALLFQKNIIPPKSVPLVPFRAKSYYSLLSAMCGLDFLKASKVNPNLCKICIYDLNGQYTSLVKFLIPYTSDLRIITNNIKAYKTIIYDSFENFGAPITVDSSRELCKNCGIVFAPKLIKELLPLCSNSLVFTKHPPTKLQVGHFIHSPQISLSKEIGPLCPKGIDPTYFAAALYEKYNFSQAVYFPIKGCTVQNRYTDFSQIMSAVPMNFAQIT